MLEFLLLVMLLNAKLTSFSIRLVLEIRVLLSMLTGVNESV